MGAKISSLVFQPPEVTYMHAKKHIIWLRTVQNINIPAFYIDRRSKVTLLFSHGNAEDLGMIYDWFCELSKQIRVNILAYDYEGYGKTEGEPNEKSCYEDIDAAYEFLTKTLHTPSENIVLYGRSLGSGPSCYLAERLHKANVRIGGLILQSALLSIFRVAFNFRITLPCDMFPNVDRLRRGLSCPVFCVHGVKDEVVPFWNGELLFLAVPVQWRARPFWVDEGGHNNLEDIFRDNRGFFEAFEDFLSEWVPAYACSSLGAGSPAATRANAAAASAAATHAVGTVSGSEISHVESMAGGAGITAPRPDQQQNRQQQKRQQQQQGGRHASRTVISSVGEMDFNSRAAKDSRLDSTPHSSTLYGTGQL